MTGWFRKKEVARVWLIERDPSNLMIKKSKVISGDQRKGFQHDLTEKLRKGTIEIDTTITI